MTYYATTRTTGACIYIAPAHRPDSPAKSAHISGCVLVSKPVEQVSYIPIDLSSLITIKTMPMEQAAFGVRDKTDCAVNSLIKHRRPEQTGIHSRRILR